MTKKRWFGKLCVSGGFLPSYVTCCETKRDCAEDLAFIADEPIKTRLLRNKHNDLVGFDGDRMYAVIDPIDCETCGNDPIECEFLS